MAGILFGWQKKAGKVKRSEKSHKVARDRWHTVYISLLDAPEEVHAGGRHTGGHLSHLRNQGQGQIT